MRAMLWRVAPLALLLLFFGLLMLGVTMQSPTLDEQNHIARGLAYLRTGDLRLSQEHPPGVNVWEAWPLLLDPAIRLPLDSPSWANAEWYGFADQMLWRVNDRPQATVLAARVPVMWIALLLAAFAYRWARDLGGRWAGLVALAMLVLDPNILAHGRLATTDMGVTCAALVAMFALQRALQDPRWARWLVAGIAFGAAQMCKFSALVLAPLVLLMPLIAILAWATRCTHRRLPPSYSGRGLYSWALSQAGVWAARLLLLFGAGAFVVWAGYAFTWGPIDMLGGLPGPAPAYWAGIARILQRTTGGTPTFFMGQYGQGGWLAYFPVAFALKTPLPTLALLAAAVAGVLGRAVVWSRDKACSNGSPASPCRADALDEAHGNNSPASSCQSQSDTESHAESVTYMESDASRSPSAWALACLLLPVAGFWAMAMGGSFNIGYRHILPSLPFLYVLAGWQLGQVCSRGAAFPRQTAGHVGHACSVTYLGSTCHPERSEGSTAARTGPSLIRYLVPAICLALLAWLAIDTLCIAPHYLAFFSAIAGGPDNGYRFLVDSNLDWGQDLPGLVHYVREQGLDRIYLSWFGAAHPEAYDLPFHPLPGFWRFRDEPATYGFNPYAPAPGVYAISVTNLQGVNLVDHDTYRWFREQTPVANIGHSIRIYRVERAPAWRAVVVLAVPMSQLAAEERALLGRATSVRQYDADTGTIWPAMGGPIRFITPKAPAGSQVVRTGPGYVVAEARAAAAPASAPAARFGGFVALVDSTIADPAPVPGSTLRVTVRWSVEQAPHRAAVSFAHLLDAAGRYVTGWDGLTAPATCWQPGDLIVQQYDIPIPADLAPSAFAVEVGWYDADTLQRWPCVVSGEARGDRLLLADVQVGK